MSTSHDPIETVGDLRAALDSYYPETPIRWAAQPGWPYEYAIGGIAQTPDDADRNGVAPTVTPVVWLKEGRQVGYLPGIASNALGW